MVNRAYRNKFANKSPLWVILILVLVGFVTSVSVMAAGEDDYLSALKQEAQKVDNNGDASEGSSGSGESANSSADQAAFEAELKEKYAGSAVFYSKLPAGSQEEIFLEYRDGATISELRKKIMDRFLHR